MTLVLQSSDYCLVMSYVVSTQYTSATDRQTDGQTQTLHM